MDAAEELALIRRIADELPVGVWVARAPGGEFLYANKAFAQILGTAGRSDVGRGEYAEPYGIHARDGSLYPEDRMPFVRALQENAEVIVDDIVIHRPDGGKAYIRAVAKPHFDEDQGAPTMVSVAFIDITREVLAESAREESEARMRRTQRLESVGNLAAGIAHDFNNLLAVVRTLATLSGEEDDPRRRSEDLAVIRDVTESAVQLTRSLLGFAGRGKNRSEPVSLSAIVKRMLPLLERALDTRIEIEPDLRAQRLVLGDPTMLEQVVMNLVVNARDAMPEGGRLAIVTYDHGERTVLEVIDNGSGIAQGIRERVFEPYFTTKQEAAFRGAGLGLATVYGVVESHGGSIEIRDPDGGGPACTSIYRAEPRLRTRSAPPSSRRAPRRCLAAAGSSSWWMTCWWSSSPIRARCRASGTRSSRPATAPRRWRSSRPATRTSSRCSSTCGCPASMAAAPSWP